MLLRETLALNSRTYALELGDYDLTQAMLPEEDETVSGQLVREPKYWAESLTGLELVLQPHIFRN